MKQLSGQNNPYADEKKQHTKRPQSSGQNNPYADDLDNPSTVKESKLFDTQLNKMFDDILGPQYSKYLK